MIKKLCYIRLVLITWLLSMFIWGSPVFAAKWYDYYLKAREAGEKRDWETAITLYKQAIESAPEPAKKKKYGFRSTPYYPYLELGLVYLKKGDFQNAHTYCEQAREKGVAPQKAVNSCLAVTAKALKTTQPASSQPSASATPSIRLLSRIPAETTQNEIELHGIVEDEDGIQKLDISVENLGVTWTEHIPVSQRKQEEFETVRVLDPGKSTITIEATDTHGEVARQEFSIVRTASVILAQTPISVPTPAPIPISTPIPTPIPPPAPTPAPTSQPDTHPSIVMISEIPAETTETTLKVRGIAYDDHGIQDVKVNVKQAGQAGSKGLIVGVPAQRQQDQFTADVTLHIGQNTITVEAIDTRGQRATKSFTVVKKSLPTPLPSQGTSATAMQRPGNVYAVIIGIGDYKDERIPDLRYTVNDAKGLYNVLADPNYGGVPENHIRLLLNEKATDRNIKEAIGRWLRRQATEEDTVIIYYSGHGAPEEGDTYWVTHNADIDTLYTTALNNNDLATMLESIQSERVITFLDSCYSAATIRRKVKTRSIATEIPWDKFSGKGRVAISASDGKQLSLELDEYQHGVFTYYLLEGLKGQADQNRDGVIDVDEIWDYVKYQVIESARKAGNPQTPVLQGSLTAGIPITFNLSLLRQKDEEQQIARKLKQLKDFFTEGHLSPQHYNCSYKILKSGGYNIWIESLLSGEIDPEVFSESFDCR